MGPSVAPGGHVLRFWSRDVALRHGPSWRLREAVLTCARTVQRAERQGLSRRGASFCGGSPICEGDPEDGDAAAQASEELNLSRLFKITPPFLNFLP